LYTVPLFAGAVWVFVRRAAFRRALVTGLVVSSAYLGVRVASQLALDATDRDAYPEAESVHVLPS
jgi:inner membrane protein